MVQTSSRSGASDHGPAGRPWLPTLSSLRRSPARLSRWAKFQKKSKMPRMTSLSLSLSQAPSLSDCGEDQKTVPSYKWKECLASQPRN